MAEVLIDTEDSEEIVEFFRNDNAYDFFVVKNHEVEFCPERGISKTNNQSRCHIWQVAHKFGVAF